VNGAADIAPSRLSAVPSELPKLLAFARRDFLDAWSYRAAFFTDIATMLFQLVVFYFVGKMINPSVLPEFGGERATYVEFVAVGLVINGIVGVGLSKVGGALRAEQLKGTLEVLLMTPTALGTIQLGSVVYDLVHIPIRTTVFLLGVVLLFGAHIDPGGLVPALVLLLCFMPFVWGLGLVSAAGILTFKQGNVATSVFFSVMAISSGAYFPLELLPTWVTPIAEANPLAIAIEGLREALLGGTGWAGIGGSLAILVPTSAVMLPAGIFAFRLALARERRRGTLALY
jgi:ABC-2 type transport system permease protein